MVRMDSSYWEPMPECQTALGARISQTWPGAKTFEKISMFYHMFKKIPLAESF